jgi:tetratricopeptide (TPR) repeat protein
MPRWLAPLLLLACSTIAVAGNTTSQPPAHLPVTTRSAQARRLFESGMDKVENLQINPALRLWRAAIRLDDQFALAHLFVGYLTKDPIEERNELARARQLMPQVSPAERLAITWIAGARENAYLEAIAAMNDLLAQYPNDSRLAFLAARWLMSQDDVDQGVALLERAVAGSAADYPAVLNELGYGYAVLGDFDKAFLIMERYSAVSPWEPEPRDAFGEVLRMAGQFDRALLQYRAALKIDPKFYSSQLGLAETYALMGDEQRARTEYAKAIAMSPSKTEKLEFRVQEAMTYVREGQHETADEAFEAIEQEAHRIGVERIEAQVNRIMGTFAPDWEDASHHLEEAEKALVHARAIAQADREEEHARILRVRVERAIAAGAMDTALANVEELKKKADASPRSVVQHSYEAAAGMLLAKEGKYSEAIPHLEEDASNCMTAALLLSAYEATGAQADADELRHRLAETNETSIEQALVVPKLRAHTAQLRAQ